MAVTDVKGNPLGTLGAGKIPCPPTGAPLDAMKIKAPNSIIDKLGAGKAKIPLDCNAGKIANPVPILTKQSFLSKFKNTKFAQTISKVGNGLKAGLGKIGKFFKGKGGKIGLMVAAGAALITGGKYLYDKFTEPKATSEEVPLTEENFSPDEQAAIIAQDLEAKQDNTRVAQPPVHEPLPVVEKEPETTVEPIETAPVEYEVKKGDNVWNIAKQHLKDLHKDEPDYKPTNAEILEHTKELMELNSLAFESDGYHVLIKPKDKLKLVA